MRGQGTGGKSRRAGEWGAAEREESGRAGRPVRWRPKWRPPSLRAPPVKRQHWNSGCWPSSGRIKRGQPAQGINKNSSFWCFFGIWMIRFIAFILLSISLFSVCLLVSHRPRCFSYHFIFSVFQSVIISSFHLLCLFISQSLSYHFICSVCSSASHCLIIWFISSSMSVHQSVIISSFHPLCLFIGQSLSNHFNFFLFQSDYSIFMQAFNLQPLGSQIFPQDWAESSA